MRPIPLPPDLIWRIPGLEEVAVQAPHAALGVMVKPAEVSGRTPQLGCPELLGQGSTVEVPWGEGSLREDSG